MRILDAIQTYIDLAEDAAADGTLGALEDAGDAAKIARVLSEVALNLHGVGLLDECQWIDTALENGWIPLEMVDEVRADLSDDEDELDFAAVCDDPECPCHVDESGDVVATLTISDDGARVKIDGLCVEHADVLAAKLFAVADGYVDDEEELVEDEA